MNNHTLRSLLAIATLSLGIAVGTPVALGAEACPNEQLRIEDNSLNLPDCRAYELVTPDSSHAAVTGGRSSPGGNMMVYQSLDAPEHALSAEGVINHVRSTRDTVNGWSGVGLEPPLPAPVTAYTSLANFGVSKDLLSTFTLADQPLTNDATTGMNTFIGHPDGTYTLLTRVASPISFFNTYFLGGLLGATPDFGSVYFAAFVPQFPSDPSGNFYGWSQSKGLRLMGVLPDESAAANGAEFRGNSDDGRYVAFNTEGRLYLRADDTSTVEVGAININPGNLRETDQAIVAENGSKVLFTSRTPQTPDANPAGKDLYSYDIATGHLSDLTIDTSPADAATGAEVNTIVGMTADGAYIYFTAAGNLAPGAIPGHRTLYVWHDGAISAIARADGTFTANGTPRGSYLTPDGQHLAFLSTDNLTGYDNTDPVTGQPHVEWFEASLGAGVQCASCRADGTRPTGDALPPEGETPFVPGVAPPRVMSDDGRRLFFQSTDAVVPQASNGRRDVFEYVDGQVAPVSSVHSPWPSSFLDASASGDDVFFETEDELLPNPNGGDSAVYDARLDGGFPVVSREKCSASSCRAQLPPPAAFAAPSTTTLSATGNVASPAPAPIAGTTTTSAAKTRAQKLSKALKACKKRKHKRAACEKSARKKYGRRK